MQTKTIMKDEDRKGELKDFEKYRKDLINYVFHVVNKYKQRATFDRENAEDVVQDVFIEFYKYHQKNDVDLKKLKGLLLVMTKRKYIAGYMDSRSKSVNTNKIWKISLSTIDEQIATVGWHSLPDPIRRSYSEHSELNKSEERQSFIELKNRINSVKNGDMLLMEEEGYTREEIAKIKGVTKSSVGTLMSRARVILKRELEC